MCGILDMFGKKTMGLSLTASHMNLSMNALIDGFKIVVQHSQAALEASL